MQASGRARHNNELGLVNAPKPPLRHCTQLIAESRCESSSSFFDLRGGCAGLGFVHAGVPGLARLGVGRVHGGGARAAAITRTLSRAVACGGASLEEGSGALIRRDLYMAVEEVVLVRQSGSWPGGYIVQRTLMINARLDSQTDRITL